MEPIEYERMNAAEGRMWWYRALHANVLDALRRHPGPTGSMILDAGCGTGGLLALLARAMPDRALVGIDLSDQAAGFARAKSGATILLSSADHLPVADASVGAILSIDVLYHRAVDPEAAVAEAYRCLMPGGTLIVNLPAYQWMSSFHDRQVHGARRYDRPGLRRLLANQPFSQVRVGYWNSLLFPLMVLRRKLAPDSSEASDVGEFPKLLEHAFGAIMAAERAGRRAGIAYPFGGSVMAIAIR